ncbi:protein EVI2B [Tachysurus vachellii]|uniref:protein EVI2B n=1 Tax=Tachysurus vachellii TaxID=175792 RepID=UPI00296AEEE3|nr:protein EVI2B [Tachysurus vachellii]
MKSILTTCALFLVLPWTLTGETTLKPKSTWQHTVAFKDHQTTKSDGEPTNFSPTNIHSLQPNNEITNSTMLQEGISTDRKTTKSDGEPTNFSPTNIHSLQPNNEITNSTMLQEGLSTDRKTTKSDGEPTNFSPTNIHSLQPNNEITNSTMLQEGISTDRKTTKSDGEPTNFSPTNIHSLQPNNEITNSTMLQEGISTDRKTTKSDGEPTNFSPKSMELTLKPNGETTHKPKSTSLHKGTYKDHEHTTRGSEEYTTEEKENVLSSKSPPQTSVHQETPAMTNSTGESRSSLHLSPLPFLEEFTQKKTITTQPQDMSEEVIITRDNQFQTKDDHFKSTNKGLDRYTQGNRATRSSDKEFFTPQTDKSTPFQKPPEVITTETLTTEWSSLHQEKEITQTPVLNITDSNEILNISNQERNDTSTYPLNTSTTAGFSTGLGPTVKTEVARWDTTDTSVTNATYEMTTNGKISERKPYPKPSSETTATTHIENTKTIKPKPAKDNNNKNHPGFIVASLIGSILFLMFIAFVVVLVRNRQMKKKKMENTDWAGPSPFIDGDNLPNINEDGAFHRRESKRISLNSFLPQRLSKRFSMLSPTDEEVPLEDIQVSSTFGQQNVQSLNEKATPNQTRTHDANNSPTEISSDSKIPESVSIPPAPENKENIQTAPKPDEIIPSTPAEKKSITPTPFEDVDLNGSLNKNIESALPSDAIHVPFPPPLPSS